jgi:hypothetical protein
MEMAAWDRGDRGKWFVYDWRGGTNRGSSAILLKAGLGTATRPFFPSHVGARNGDEGGWVQDDRPWNNLERIVQSKLDL